LNLGLVDGSGELSYTGDGTSGVFVFGFQAELGDIATDYIPTTTAAVSVGMTADVPRLDYLGSSCPSLLLEPQRTNDLQFSEQLDNDYWTKDGATITANNTISPDGYQSADLINYTGGNNRVFRSLTKSASALTYTLSAYVKRNTLDALRLSLDGGSFSNRAEAIFNISTGTLTSTAVVGTFTNQSGSIVDVGNGWYRCTLTATTGTEATIRPHFFGTTSESVYIWGAQLEEGSYPTSYIPTLGTSVTRVADATGNKDITSFAIGNSYTVLFDLNLPTSETNKLFYEFRTSTNTTSFTVRNFAGGFRAYNNIDTVYTLAQYTSSNGKYIIRVDGTSYNFFYLNAGVATKLSATLTTARNFGYFLFDGSASALNLDQHLIFKGALTDAQCNDLIS
jgi:hypothetical protein